MTDEPPDPVNEGITNEDRSLIAAYLRKSPIQRRPEDLMPTDGNDESNRDR